MHVSGCELTLFQKTIKGSLFGSANPQYDIVRLLRLYDAGQLKLDELITTRYTLEEVNQGYQDLRDGKNIRGRHRARGIGHGPGTIYPVPSSRSGRVAIFMIIGDIPSVRLMSDEKELAMIGNIIGTIIFGAVIGVLARLVIPGKQAMGWVITIVLGIAGA